MSVEFTILSDNGPIQVVIDVKGGRSPRQYFGPAILKASREFKTKSKLIVIKWTAITPRLNDK